MRPRNAARIAVICRWVARVWSILIFTMVAVMIFVPDPNLVTPVPVTDWLMLATFPGLAVLGLLLAWRWEAVGGVMPLAGFVVQLLEFRVFRGEWFPAGGMALNLLFFVVPGILFLLSWYMTGKSRRNTGNL